MAIAPFRVGGTVVQLDKGLTAGQEYIAQNVGYGPVQYANHATDPSAVDIGWNVVDRLGWFSFMVVATDPVWVRTGTAASELSIVEKN